MLENPKQKPGARTNGSRRWRRYAARLSRLRRQLWVAQLVGGAEQGAAVRRGGLQLAAVGRWEAQSYGMG